MRRLILKIIRLYQKFISPVVSSLKPHRGCRFYPSCSEYCAQAISKYGTIKGAFKGFLRILRCNPLNRGGIDLC